MCEAGTLFGMLLVTHHSWSEWEMRRERRNPENGSWREQARGTPAITPPASPSQHVLFLPLLLLLLLLADDYVLCSLSSHDLCSQLLRPTKSSWRTSSKHAAVQTIPRFIGQHSIFTVVLVFTLTPITLTSGLYDALQYYQHLKSQDDICFFFSSKPEWLCFLRSCYQYIKW